uniref:Uncharacterized protein n=1 Tax=Rhizophagus irregularis (strain DAOM 181602 / DAOM 197198 / MUCL 43194) TaxID=747089 RepID=U9T5J1_RHIID
MLNGSERPWSYQFYTSKDGLIHLSIGSLSVLYHLASWPKWFWVPKVTLISPKLD